MDAVGGIRPPPALGDDVPVAHDHEAVEAEVLSLHAVDEVEESGGVDALRRRGAAGKGHEREATRSRSRVGPPDTVSLGEPDGPLLRP
ncbi:hypothetical protein GCM10027039_12510 [Terrabacter koreensis]